MTYHNIVIIRQVLIPEYVFTMIHMFWYFYQICHGLKLANAK